MTLVRDTPLLNGHSAELENLDWRTDDSLPTQQPSHQQQSLRIATYNIEMGGNGREAQLLSVLQRTDADIIGLTEADDEKVVAQLAEQLNMHYQWARGSGDRHVATLSRYPITRWQIYNKKPLTQAALSTTIALPFAQLPSITTYNVHLRPDPFWHFEMLRWLATVTLVGVIKHEKAGPHIVMGDLNTFAANDSVDIQVLLSYTSERDRQHHKRQRFKFLRLAHRTLLRMGYLDCYRHLHPLDKGFTFTRYRIPISRMDFVFADPTMSERLVACDTLANEAAADASDHFPVVAKFQLS